MLNCLLKAASVFIVILDITQAILHDRPDWSIEAETPKDPSSGNEEDNYIPNPARSRSWLGELRIRRDSEILTSPNAEVPVLESLLLSGLGEPILNIEVSNTANPPPSGYDDPTLNEDAYISDYDNDTKKEYCLWFDNKKKKEYKMHNGTYWSGNGCKLLHCINGTIIPDPSCCKITTRKHGFSINYTLYQNQGERTIAACEVMVCNSGLINKVKKISGCCIYDDVQSIEDGEFWMASPANTSNNNQCNLGTCNNETIQVKQLEEGEVWGHGCMNYICEDSSFHVNKVDLPGSCMMAHGNCITNGTTVKLWNECKGIMCVNGKLFKGFLPECSLNDKLLYRAYNH